MAIDLQYEFVGKIGDPASGDVSLYRERHGSKCIAVKKLSFEKHENGGVPSTVLREISLLRQLKHPNIARLLEVWTDEGGEVNLGYEYLDLDLEKFILQRLLGHVNSYETVKGILRAILQGVAYCHSHNLVHRDLKPSNVLIDLRKSLVKIADFGLARPLVAPGSEIFGDLVMLKYRAPELLLGFTNKCSFPVDIWAVGCIFAEMLLYTPLFFGYSADNMLFKIFGTLGLPTEETWPGVTASPLYPSSTRKILFQINKRDLPSLVKGLEPAGFDLLSKMLCLNPDGRISAADALNHRYFRSR